MIRMKKLYEIGQAIALTTIYVTLILYGIMR